MPDNAAGHPAAVCPACGKRVLLDARGRLWPHVRPPDPVDGLAPKCERSETRPERKDG